MMKKILIGVIVLEFLFIPVAIMFAGFILFYVSGGSGDPPLDVALAFYNSNNPTHRTQLINFTLAIFAVLSFLSIGSAIKYALYRRRLVFGQTKMATRQQVKKAGLLNNKGGIFFGYFNGRPLFDDSQLHILLVAESGTGKGVSLVIPNLFLWSGSVICTDLKKENFRFTSGYRQSRGQDVFCFDPFSNETHRINPLSYIDPNNPIDHFQRIAYIVYPDPDRGDKIWTSSARSLFIGLATLLYLERGKEAVSFSNIINLQATLDLTKIDARLAKIKNRKSLVDRCWQILGEHAKTPDRTRGGIEKEFSSRLDIFLNPLVAWATSANDVPLERLRKDPITLYLSCSPSNISRVSFIMRMITETVNILNTQEEFSANPEHKYHLLLLNDEQHNFFGRMELMMKAASFYRSYGIRIFSVYQSLSQIKIDYGEQGAKSYIDNHDMKIYYCPQDREKAKLVSQAIGETTVFTKSKSRSSGRLTSSDAPQRREAYLPEELQQLLGETHGLLFKSNTPAIRFKKAVWHKEKTFTERKLPPVDLPKISNDRLDQFLTESNPGASFNPAAAQDPVLQLAEKVKNGAPDDEIFNLIDATIMEGSYS